MSDGPDDQHYNCLHYALGTTDTSVSFGNNLSDTHETLTNLGYEPHSLTNNCIAVYGFDNGYVGHFAKVENGIVTSRLGAMEIMQHSQVDAFMDINDSYGKLLRCYVRFGG